MRSYKLVLLIKSDLKKENKEKLLSDIKKWMGKIENEKVTDLGNKKLAYMINKEKSADYLVYSFEAENISADLDKRLLMQEDILRHLIIREK